MVRLPTGRLVALLALGAAVAATGEPAPLEGLEQVLPERTGPRGQVLPWSTTRAPPTLLRQAALTPALQRTWERKLLAVAAALRRAPVLASPRGFHLQLQGSLGVIPGQPPPRALLAGALRLWAWPLDQLVGGRGGAPRLRPGASVPALELSFNEPPEPRSLEGLDWMRDERGAFFTLPGEAQLQGFPVIAGELWLSPPGAGPFRPVSRERLIDAFLRAHPRPTGSLARLAARYGALRDAVSAEALAGPAWLSDDPLEPALVQPDVPGARPVLELVPGFLAPAAGRAEVRLVRVKGLEAAAQAARQPADSPQRVYLEVLQQVDWKALMAAAGR